jgi:hypothetical protein
MAMGLRWQWWPLGALAIALPDLDHLPLPFLSPRVETHALWFTLLLPWALLVGYARWGDRRAPYAEFIAALPALFNAHLLIDMLPSPSEIVTSAAPFSFRAGENALLYPFSSHYYWIVPAHGSLTEIGTPSSFTLFLVGLLLLGVAGRYWVYLLRLELPYRKHVFAIAVPFVLILVVVGAAFATGVLGPTTEAPAGHFALASFRIHPQSGILTGTIVKVGGADAWPNGLTLRISNQTAVVAEVTCASWVTGSDPWRVNETLPLPLGSQLELDLLNVHANLTYASAALLVNNGTY